MKQSAELSLAGHGVMRSGSYDPGQIRLCTLPLLSTGDLLRFSRLACSGVQVLKGLGVVGVAIGAVAVQTYYDQFRSISGPAEPMSSVILWPVISWMILTTTALIDECWW